MIAHVHGAKYKFKCFTWSKAVRHAARTSHVLRKAAEVSLLTITVQAVTEAQFPTCPFTGLHLGMHPHTGTAGQPAHRFQQSKPCANTRTGLILLHVGLKCGTEGINQWRPGCEVHGLSHKGLLKKHSVWALPILTREREQICHVYYPSLSRDEK